MLSNIVFRGHGIDSGTFGAVFEGFHPKTGDIKVVKVIQIKKKHEIPAVNREIEALERFRGREGILDLVEWSTAKSGKDINELPMLVYLVQDKGVAFNKVTWTDASLSRPPVKRLLCYQLLKGLEAIHTDGCMHRDITPQNILLLLSEEGPKAVLCDFGKFCNHNTDTDTYLAAWRFLPPEMVKPPAKPIIYNQAIDIWMLGLALTISWWPECKDLEPRDREAHMGAIKILFDERPRHSLAHAVALMISRDPELRPSAVECLEHECFRELIQQKMAVKPSESKRLHED
ncbi:MAG: hypothetical protein Q9209_001960 [Squamulea sp. 1 TL-2023]